MKATKLRKDLPVQPPPDLVSLVSSPKGWGWTASSGLAVFSLVLALTFGVNVSQAGTLWREVSVSNALAGKILIGGEQPNPVLALPMPEVLGKWVRFSANVLDNSSDIRFVINTFLDQDKTKLGGRNQVADCEQHGTESRCSVVMWIPPDVKAVNAIIWANEHAGQVSNITVETSEPVPGRAMSDVERLTFGLLKSNYYRRHEVNWDELWSFVNAIPQLPSELDFLPIFFSLVRNRLPGSEHLFLTENVNLQGSDTDELPSCHSLGKATFLLKLPGMPSIEQKDMQRYAQTARQCLTLNRTSKRWVLDLRGNGGGNMYPMLSGISPLLQRGPIYYHVDAAGNAVETISASPKGISADHKLVVSNKLSLNALNGTPLVVLLDGTCASSCESVVLSLSSRRDTLFVGTPTAGFTTANVPHRINDRYTLLLTESWMANPCRQRVQRRLTPDVEVPEISTMQPEAVMNDRRLEDWLSNNAPRSQSAPMRCRFSDK